MGVAADGIMVREKKGRQAHMRKHGMDEAKAGSGILFFFLLTLSTSLNTNFYDVRRK